MLSLITAYRDRESHLKLMQLWLERIRLEEEFCDFEWIIVEGSAVPTAAGVLKTVPWIHYCHIPMTGLFHKSLLLNMGASMSHGEFLVPLDVDLLPATGVLPLLLRLSQNCPDCLFSGFRVLLDETPLLAEKLPSSREFTFRLQLQKTAVIGPEDQPSALYKYLLAGERFGVCPAFPRSLFFQLQGYDEDYIGWGAEDQDIFERACLKGLTPLKSYDLLFFHMPHSQSNSWNDPALIKENRRRFYEKRSKYLNG